jgi:uncharacterized protein (DUF608 family)
MDPKTHVSPEIVFHIFDFTFVPGYGHTSYALVCKEWNQIVEQIIQFTKTVTIKKTIVWKELLLSN